MKRLLIILLSVLLAICFSNYAYSGMFDYVSSIFSSDISDRKETLEEAMNEYEKAKQKTGNDFHSGVKYFKQSLANAKQKDIDFKQVHDRWESVENQVDDLGDKFSNQVEKADLLFKEYYSKANEINNETQRNKVIEKIDDSFEIYKSAYVETKSRIDQLWALYNKVNDNIISLEIITSLNEIQSYVNSLKEIETEANMIMKELDELSKTTSSMVDLKIN